MKFGFPPGFLKRDIKRNTRETKDRHLCNRNNLKYFEKFKRRLVTALSLSAQNDLYRFSLHAFISFEKTLKQVPLMCVFMSRRTTEDYEADFKHTVKLYQSGEQDKEPLSELKKFLCDFEITMWKAVRKVFPNVTLRGCGFHVWQAIFRKIQLGLI